MDDQHAGDGSCQVLGTRQIALEGGFALLVIDDFGMQAGNLQEFLWVEPLFVVGIGVGVGDLPGGIHEKHGGHGQDFVIDVRCRQQLDAITLVFDDSLGIQTEGQAELADGLHLQITQ